MYYTAQETLLCLCNDLYGKSLKKSEYMCTYSSTLLQSKNGHNIINQPYSSKNGLDRKKEKETTTYHILVQLTKKQVQNHLKRLWPDIYLLIPATCFFKHFQPEQPAATGWWQRLDGECIKPDTEEAAELWNNAALLTKLIFEAWRFFFSRKMCYSCLHGMAVCFNKLITILNFLQI